MQRSLLVFGEFALDPHRRRLSRLADDSTVPLTPKGIDALVFLVEHRHALLDKDTLLAALWPDAIVEENSLTQTISGLRRALGEKRGENRYVATIPGRGYRFVADVAIRGAGPPRTVAVLPFVPLVPSDRNESLEFGMTEALVTSLSALPNLRVCPLSAVRVYGGADRDPIAAGNALHVDSVLDGSLQHETGRLRVAVRLLRVGDGQQIWHAVFDQDSTTIFDLQDAIARKVSDALSAVLSPGQRLVKQDTASVEAYRWYASGRLAWSRSSETGLEQAIDHFKRAIAHDERYARAYAGLSDCYGVLAVFQIRAPHSVFPDARAAASKAIELDPTLAEGYVTMGHVKAQYEHDWIGGERAYRRALELDPRSTFAHLYHGLLSAYRGNFEEALAGMRRAQQLEPMWPATTTCIGMTMYFARRYPEAIAELEQTLAADERWDMARSFLGRTYLRTGQPHRALDEFRACRNRTPGSDANIGSALALLGRRDEARLELQRLADLSERRYVSAYDVATIHAALGDADAAVRSLEAAFAERSTLIGWLPHDAAFDGMRDDSRFAALIGRLG